MDDFETAFEKEFPGVHIVGAKTVRRWDLVMIILSIAVCIVAVLTARVAYFKSIFMFVCICVIGAGALSSFLEYRNSKSKSQLGWSIGWLALCVMNIIVELI